MTALSRLRHFARDPLGAVSVDWVVLTAAAVTLALAVTTTVRLGAKTGVDTMSDRMDGAMVSTFD